jgi:hypothetical protein
VLVTTSILRFRQRAAIGAAALTLAAISTAGGQARLNKYGYPEKRAPRPTAAAITPEDLMTRLYIFADDSMQGRQYGRVGNMIGTNYIANELRRLGLRPAGDSGTYFQRLAMVQRRFTDRSTLTVDGASLRFNTDFVPVPTPRAPKPIQNVQVVFGGTAGDTSTMISPEQAAGKLVLFLSAPGGGGGAAGRGGQAGGDPGAASPNACLAVLNPGAGPQRGGRGGLQGGGGVNLATRYSTAAALGTIDLDLVPPGRRGMLNNPIAVAAPRPPAIPRAPIIVTRNGVTGTIEAGRLAGGALPGGMTPVQVQRMLDSVVADSLGRARRAAAVAAIERVRSCALADSIAVSHGAQTMMGPGGIAAADSAAMASLGPAGGRGGRGGGGGGGGRGGATGGGFDNSVPLATIRLTRAAAERLLGASLDGMSRGSVGRTVSASLAWEERDASDWARNVVAMVPGSDPALKGQYVLLSAHNDHVGFTANTLDHDSVKAVNDAVMRFRLGKKVGDLIAETAQERQSITVNVDSLRKIRPARPDSINNGADDDGSGSMALLEIAEFISKMPVKPRRSTLFVWQTGEEAGGLQGSAYFASHPTVPIDSIVANINLDMVGRGRAEDIPGGGPTYLGVVGSGFLSSDLARVVASTNVRQKTPLALDPKFDLFTTWPGYNSIYTRSDHYSYARQCIPIAFFFTGLHGDYHQRTDEPQYIDYPHLSLITNFIKDVVVELGTRPDRPSLDKPCVR